MVARERKNAILLTALASLIWGSSFPGAKWGLGFAGNDVFFLWLRFLVASAITLSIVLYLRRFSFSILKKPAVWLVGLFNSGAFIAQYVGLNYTTASKTALLVDINVIAVAMVSYFVFRERIGRMQALGVASGMVGIFMLTTEGGLALDGSQLLGDVLVYVAGWGWAFFIIINKKLLDHHNGIEVSTAAIVTSTIWLILPVSYLYLTGADFSIEPMGWVAVVYLGLFCTSIAMLLWALGLEGVSATASATIMLLEVVVALVLSIGLLEESLSLVAFAGAALVMAAIYLVSAGEKEPEVPTLGYA